MASIERVGIIGLGVMGQRMLQSMRAHDRFSVVRVHDADSARAARVGQLGSGVAVAEAADEILSAEDVDLVYIATPPATHVPLAREALAHGKAVFVEKPLAVDLTEAAQLVETIERLGAVGAVNFPFATLPGLTRVEKELAENRAGNVERVDIILHFSRWPRTWHGAGEWLSGAAEGGFLREVFSHFVYLTHRVLGPLNLLRGDLRFGAARKAETHATADFEWAGVPVSLVAGVGGAAPDYCEWTLYASQRSYRLQDWSLLKVGTASRWYDVLPEEELPRFPGAAQLDALVERLEGRPSAIPDLRTALEVQRVVEGLLTAGRG